MLSLCVAAPVLAETNQEGDLRVSFDSGLHPSRLPRRAPAPVAVRVAGNFQELSGDATALPQLQRIVVAINRQGKLFDRGLPTCDVAAIQPASEAAAARECGDAIVGSGHVRLQVRIPTQPPFQVSAKLLAFNGPRSHGRKLILAQAYARTPPGAFVLEFRVSRRKGVFGTVLSTTLPRAARRWAYLTHFDMTLHRTYTYGGKRRSYVSAACSAPARFHTALFPLARATYTFGDGQVLAVPLARTCRVLE